MFVCLGLLGVNRLILLKVFSSRLYQSTLPYYLRNLKEKKK